MSALLTPRETGNEEVRTSRGGNNCVPLTGSRAIGRCGARSAGLQGLRAMPLARARSKHDRTKSRRSLGTEGGWTVELRTLLRGAQGVGHYLGRSIAGRMADRSGPNGAGQ